MADKHIEEIEFTRRLLLALGRTDFMLNPSDRPDVDAAICGRSIGVEVTVFHSLARSCASSWAFAPSAFVSIPPACRGVVQINPSPNSEGRSMIPAEFTEI